MKTIKKVIIVSFMFAITFTIKAQLYIKNATSKPVSIAVGWYSESKDYTGYVTKGWYNIEPGETINPGLTFTSSDDHYYYYAKGWEGNTKLLVGGNEAFNIKNAHLQYVKDANPSYKWVMFRRKDVHFDFLETKTRTLKLTESSAAELDSIAAVKESSKWNNNAAADSSAPIKPVRKK